MTHEATREPPGSPVRERLPPRLATWLIGGVAASRDREALLGDLAEEFDALSRAAGRPAAICRYWEQCVRSLPVLVWAAVSDAGWLGTWGVAIVMFVAISWLEVAVLSAAGGLVQGDLPHLLVGLAALGLGGSAAHILRPAAVVALAIISAVVGAVLMIVYLGSAPIWLQAGFFLLGPAACLAGGAVRIRWRFPASLTS